jgi:hypothetical protein
MRKHLVARKDDSNTPCASQSYFCFGLWDSALTCHAANSRHYMGRTTHNVMADTMDAVG